MLGDCARFCANKWIVVIVVALYLLEWVTYDMVCTPSAGWAVAFNLLNGLALWSYLATSFTDPGSPATPEWQAWSASRPKQEPVERSEDERTRTRGWAPGEVSWCRVCKCERPERAHHCSHCGVCILRMDHHCPWIGGCVGWRNHKYFLLLNWWSFWACLTFLLTLRGPNALEAIDIIDLSAHFSLLPIIGVLIALFFMVITGCMFCSALSMASMNVTTIEDNFNGENPYSMSCLSNLWQVLGPPDFRILLPIPSSSGASGTAFPSEAPLTGSATDAGKSSSKLLVEGASGTKGVASSGAAYGTV